MQKKNAENDQQSRDTNKKAHMSLTLHIQKTCMKHLY